MGAGHALGLSSLHCMLLIHLTTYWWESDRNPYPSKAILAQRMGISDRQVQRYVSDLVRAGFIRRQREAIRGKGGRMIVSFDLSGLVEKLKDVASTTRGDAVTDASRTAG
jgi:predicted transcriptional regulator